MCAKKTIVGMAPLPTVDSAVHASEPHRANHLILHITIFVDEESRQVLRIRYVR